MINNYTYKSLTTGMASISFLRSVTFNGANVLVICGTSTTRTCFTQVVKEEVCAASFYNTSQVIISCWNCLVYFFPGQCKKQLCIINVSQYLATDSRQKDGYLGHAKGKVAGFRCNAAYPHHLFTSQLVQL